VQTAAYIHPDDGYFERRSLRRHARVIHLWALGVGAVISGDFFGWSAWREKYDYATLKKWLEVFLTRFFTNQYKRSAARQLSNVAHANARLTCTAVCVVMPPRVVWF